MTTETKYQFMTPEQVRLLATYLDPPPDTYIDGVYFTGNTDHCTVSVITIQKVDGKWYRYSDTLTPDGRTEARPSEELRPGAFGGILD